MKLIGMLDSPYVRRTAITLHFLDIAFEHQSLSVFSTYDRFKTINPVVKAPTLLLDDGTYLMDSTLIIDYVEHLFQRSLMPTDLTMRLTETARVGLALAACEKTVQRVYENNRPADKQYANWSDRVDAQLLAAYTALEASFIQQPISEGPITTLTQGLLTTAVAWQFTQYALPNTISAADFPALASLSERAAALTSFKACPIE